MSNDFRSLVLTGLSWSIASQVGRQSISFLIGIILARLLSPEEFGMMAMVIVFTGFANIFAELGFGAALIQKKKVEERHLSSVFWLNLGAGLVLTVLFILVSPLIADFYNEPILKPLTIVLAINFLVHSAGILHRTLFSKKIDFKSLSLVEITAVLISGVIGIGMAMSGYGVWSLAFKAVFETLLSVALLWAISPWRPKLLFDIQALKELLSFSLHLLGDKILNYLTSNLDDLLIGKYVSSSSLGVYSKAYSIMQMPMKQISRVISRVMFPSLAKIQDDQERIAGAYLKITRVIALFTFPMMLGLLTVSDTFVLVVFGTQWLDMVPFLQVFCVLGMAKSIGTLVGNLYLSQGRADLQFKLGVGVKLLMVVSIIVGLQWGALGVAICYTIACFIAFYPEFYFAGKLVGLTWYDLVKNLYKTLIIAVLMAFSVHGIGVVLDNQLSIILILSIQVISGVILYLLCINIFKVEAYHEVKSLVYEKVSSLRAV